MLDKLYHIYMILYKTIWKIVVTRKFGGKIGSQYSKEDPRRALNE